MLVHRSLIQLSYWKFHINLKNLLNIFKMFDVLFKHEITSEIKYKKLAAKRF